MAATSAQAQAAGLYVGSNGILTDGTLAASMTRNVATTGATIAMTRVGRINYLFIDPAGTLATLTVNLPSSPVDGDEVVISTSQTLTALTIANGTIIGTLTTLALGGFARFMYNAASTSWFRVG